MLSNVAEGFLGDDVGAQTVFTEEYWWGFTGAGNRGALFLANSAQEVYLFRKNSISSRLF